MARVGFDIDIEGKCAELSVVPSDVLSQRTVQSDVATDCRKKTMRNNGPHRFDVANSEQRKEVRTRAPMAFDSQR